MKILFLAAFVVVTHAGFSQDCLLVVTSGGGITGAATVYQVSLDGKVLRAKGLGPVNYSEQGSVKKSAARKYYRAARKLVESSPPFNHPGNIYYSIATNENGKETKVSWGDPQNPVAKDAKKLYARITEALSKVSFTTR